jgi:hypothetical protein
MSDYNKHFRGWVQDTFSPCAAVLLSDGAEASCRLNGLSFADLLAPFATVRQQLKVRMVGQQSVLPSFTLRFIPASDFEPRTLAQNEAALARRAAAAPPPAVPGEDVFSAAQDVEYETQWLEAAKSEIFNGQRFGQAEMLDQPCCFVYVVSSSEPNPLKSLEDMTTVSEFAGSCRTDEVLLSGVWLL